MVGVFMGVMVEMRGAFQVYKSPLNCGEERLARFEV